MPYHLTISDLESRYNTSSYTSILFILFGLQLCASGTPGNHVGGFFSVYGYLPIPERSYLFRSSLCGTVPARISCRRAFSCQRETCLCTITSIYSISVSTSWGKNSHPVTRLRYNLTHVPAKLGYHDFSLYYIFYHQHNRNASPAQPYIEAEGVRF